jgi:hypothetical protein
VSSSGSIFVKICDVVFVFVSIKCVSYIHKKVRVFGIMGCVNVVVGVYFLFFIFALYRGYLPLHCAPLKMKR